uniref:Uncharacterized protein n=1 Tax=Bos indicus x Bos taurus TaxID=30522 RepID=A0A4W2I5V4_BOBOX
LLPSSISDFFFNKLGFFLEAEHLTPSAQLPIQKAKQRRWGNFIQEPRQLQRTGNTRSDGRAGGRALLVWGVWCVELQGPVSAAERQENCLLGPCSTLEQLWIFLCSLFC